MIEDSGISVRLILGNAYGKVAPATMFSETFYADVKLEPGSRLPMPDDHEDRASTSSKARSRSPARLSRRRR